MYFYIKRNKDKHEVTRTIKLSEFSNFNKSNLNDLSRNTGVVNLKNLRHYAGFWVGL